MQTLQLGQSGIFISSVVMGTWQAGKQYWVGVRDEEITAALETALEQGINAFDTAEEYGAGYSEEVLGKAFHGKREKAVLMSKVFSNHLAYDQVISSCEKSLQRLNTDYLDLYQIHWPSGAFKTKPVPLEETIGALLDLKKQGKIRAIGVSNFSLDQIKSAYAISNGAIDSVQPPYSLFWRFIEKEIQPYCREKKITVLAYSPLAQGFLTGKFGAGHRFDKADHRKANKLNIPDVFAKVLEALAKLRVIAERESISLSQLALAWVVAHENTAAISGVRNADQIIENAKALCLNLSSAVQQEAEAAAEPVSSMFLNDSMPWSW